MTLVDTNVLLDIATNDRKWASWSLYQLDAASIRGPVVINAVVYAEFSIGYKQIEELEQVLSDTGLELKEGHTFRISHSVRRRTGAGLVRPITVEQYPFSASAPPVMAQNHRRRDDFR